MLIQDVRRKPDENEEQFLWRLGQAKDNGLLEADWTEIADVMNEEFREDESEYRGESAYRKSYQHAKKFFDSQVFSTANGDTLENFDNIIAAERELKIATQKLRDERTDYQRSIREQARKESMLDLVKRVMTETVVPKVVFDNGTKNWLVNSDDELVICLSDLHAGIYVDNAWNVYDQGILEQRLQEYLTRIIDIRNLHGTRNAYIILGGDNISGYIHETLRLENNENVIEQVKRVSMAIADFIEALEPYFECINIYSIAGNHGRTNADKKKNVKGENFDELIPFNLDLYFRHDPKIKIWDDKIDKTVGVFYTNAGRPIAYVHGDFDEPSTVVKNLTMLLKVQPDAVVMGHRHHNAYESQYGSKVIQVGSVEGMDDYCVDRRIYGKPEQVVFITGKDQVAKCIYDILLEK